MRLNIKIALLLFFVSLLAAAQSDSFPNEGVPEQADKNFDLYISISEKYQTESTVKSIDYARNAFNLVQKGGDNQRKARALNLMAQGYYMLRQYKLALEYYLKSLELSEISKNNAGIALASENIGKLYKELGDYEVAAGYYQRSLELAKKQKDFRTEASITLELGTVYYLAGKFSEAIQSLHESLSMNTGLNDQKKVWETNTMIGNTYSLTGDSDSTFFYYSQAYTVSKKINDIGLQSATLHNIGMFYVDQKNFTKALETYNTALNIEIGQDDFLSEARTFRAMGDIFLNLKRYQESLSYFNRAAEIATNIGAKKLLADIYTDLSSYFRIRNDFQQAYEYYKKASELKDQISSEHSQSQISEIESKYTMRNKDQQIQIITQENKLQSLQIKTQRYIIYIVASLSLFILALLFIFYSRFQISRKAKKDLEEKNIKITEQKMLLEKALAEITESAAIYETLIKNIQDGIFVIQDEKIRFANESFSRIAGYPLDEIYDMDYRELIHPDDRHRVETYYNKRLAGEYVPASYEFRILNRQGKTVHLSISVGIINYLGKPAHIGTIKDIYQLKTHEYELIRQKEKAELATKSKSFFLANMSHEIRNHMNSIIGISEVLEETNLDEEQKEYIHVLRNSGNNLLSIINEILDFSKIEAGQIVLEHVKFNLRELVKNVVAMFEPQSKQSGLYLNMVFGENIPEVLVGDSNRLGQILINLISNAIKFTREGGITIKTDHIPEKFISPGTNGISCFIKFEIIDTGVGINEESIDDLFKPFTQTHSATQTKQKGTGLGLAICKQLAELMNGEVGVFSEVGKGSTFWFTVKLTNPDSSVRATENAMIIDGLNSRNARILVVEDHLLNKYFMINILTKAGYVAHAAENGKIGFDLYKSNRYDVILMDIQMPVMDGIEATRLIREYEGKNNMKKSIIIAVTAHTKEGEKQRLIDAGMDYYLSKPFKSNELTGLLNELKLE